jgi:hypothetical protein
VDICKSVEDENTRLKLSISNFEHELHTLRSRASKSDLIPQYRAAILKYESNPFKPNKFSPDINLKLRSLKTI